MSDATTALEEALNRPEPLVRVNPDGSCTVIQENDGFVTIPRPQYEALVMAKDALVRSREWAWSDFEGSIEQFEEHPEVKIIDSALAALRAAGIHEGEKD